MKNILYVGLYLTIALYFTACGVPKQMAKDCGGDLAQGCKTLFGEPEQDNDDLVRDITDIKSRLSQLEATVNGNSASIELLEFNLSNTVSQLTALQLAQSTDHAAITVLQGQMSTVQAQILLLQTQTNSVQAQVTAVEAQDSVIDYLDCGGDALGYDEIVLRTKSGKLVAYFESGGSRFLSVLVPGSYATTDGSACSFSVNNLGQFCDIMSCR